MIRLALEPHPSSACEAVDAIEVAAARDGDLLRLRYLASGRLAGVRIPPPADPERAHELWRHTCFEAFIRTRGEAAYMELNLAPSSEWAAYGFGGYREGMRDLEIAPPEIEVDRSAGAIELHGTVRLPLAPPWEVAPAVVIEEMTGRRSWWAVRHPGATPDFHHPDSFVLEIP